MTIINNNVHMAVIGGSSARIFGKRYNDKVYSAPIAKKIINIFVKFLKANPSIRTISIGMNAGIDLLIGVAVYRFKQFYGSESIKLNCHIHGREHSSKFTPDELKMYHLILRQASDQILNVEYIICSDEVTRNMNKAMINNSDLTLSFWDNKKHMSQTHELMLYAKKLEYLVYTFDTTDLSSKGYIWYEPEKSEIPHVNDIPETPEKTVGEYLAEAYAEEISR